MTDFLCQLPPCNSTSGSINFRANTHSYFARQISRVRALSEKEKANLPQVLTLESVTMKAWLLNLARPVFVGWAGLFFPCALAFFKVLFAPQKKRLSLVGADKKSSSSNNTAPSGCSYHVFLSFRGEDTRKTFTDHLYTALVNAGFRTFRDDELERGEDIKPELEKAIQQSRSCVIVFSKDYASSRWCLDELVMILERKRTSDLFVLPVFYDVDPSHVRKQSGSVAKAFARHEKKQSRDKLNRWRAALTKVADVAGMVLQNQTDGHESKFINKIVNVIQEKLSRVPLSLAPHLIGIHSAVQKINLWLEDGSSNVCILGICGIGGVGKTTIAKVVYNSSFTRFEASSFLENIREISENPNGLVQLQRQFLSDILNRKVKVHSVSEGTSKIKDVISSKKVLLVLDDVIRKDQFDAILEMKGSFKAGSKIIITTRDAGLLKALQVVDYVHTVKTLNDNQSLELFSWHAFGQVHPIKSYTQPAQKVVSHCEGLPLALKTLGSSLYGQSLDVWESASKKLEVIPNGEILKKLKISYDSLLDDHDQNLFLHIACFLIGKEKNVIVKILDGCDFYTIVGIQNLINRCLVTIDEDNRVKMHQMIRDMGKEIVRQEAKEPEKRSRLWHHKDSFNVLTEKNGSESIEGLALNMHCFPAGTPLRNSVLETNGFTRMKKLRLLQLSHVQVDGSFEEFPKRLRWLCWFEFPLDSVPFEFPMENLVVLEMQYSSLRRLWKGTKNLSSLKIIDVSHSHDLTETGDFSSVPNLERLILKDCASLLEVHESIGNQGKLIYLDMEDCKVIRKLPNNIGMVKSLETLIISGCSNLNELTMEIICRMESLKVFKADEIPINRWVTTTQEVKSWPRRYLGNTLAFSPSTLVELSLGNCNLSDDIFPIDFGSSFSLQKLDLRGNPICSLPDCVRGLRRLQYLDVSNCRRLNSLEDLPKVSQLYMNFCPLLEKVAFQSISCLPDTLGFFLRAKASDKDIPSKLIEIEYWFKLEPIGKVDAEIINLLSLSNLESLTPIRIGTISGAISGTLDSIQGFSEYGIFSTFVMGNKNKVPGQFGHRSKASLPLCFTIPALPNFRIRGLNIFSVYALTTSASRLEGSILDAPVLTVIKNKSKGLRWIYVPSCWGIPSKGEDVIWVSHWNFGNQCLEAGDQVSVSVLACHPSIQVREWGFQVVHELVEKMFSQHNTYLNVIGGDLSKLYLLSPGMYLFCGGPIESCRILQRLIGHALFNFNGLVSFLNAEADSDADVEVNWQRLLFGELSDADACGDLQAMVGLALDDDADWQEMFGITLDVDWQVMFGMLLDIDWQRLFGPNATWQRLFVEAFFKNLNGLIANSDVDAKAGNEDRQQSEGKLAVAPTGESKALLRRMVINMVHRIFHLVALFRIQND